MKTIKVSFMIILIILSSLTSSTAQDNKSLKFGFYTDKIMILSQTILINDEIEKRISDIGNRLSKVSGTTNMQYTYRIINNPIINAYSAAGGFIYINTGLLDVLETEDEVAAIIAHELAHINNSHQINFIYAAHRSAIAGNIVGSVMGALVAVTIASSTSLPSVRQRALDFGNLFGEAVGYAFTSSMINGYGKNQELQADAFAVQYCNDAGYNPVALIAVFKRLISIRNRLNLNTNNYGSAAINAQPGLEDRINKAAKLISKIKEK